MSKKLQITFDEDTTKKYMEWATRRNEAEGSADMEPCGHTILIEIGTSWMRSSVFAMGGEIEFGEADAEMI